MFNKDTLRLIKKTWNRFSSLLMIVLIGTAFMMGLLSTRTIMENSVDEYDRAHELQDIQLYSSYGFDEEDAAAVRAHESVREVFASRMVDVYSEAEDGTTAVTRVEEMDRTVNRYELLEGRMPERPDEMLVLRSGMSLDTWKVGEKIRLYLEDEDLSDKLKNTEYTIVGLVRSPAYLSKTLGTGLLKNLDLQLVVYIPNENFLSEYYTTICLTLDGTEGLDSFSAAYDAAEEDGVGDMTAFARGQQDHLKGKLLEEYRAKIAEGEKEFEEKKAEGERQLEEARQKLDDANVQIVASETQLTGLETALKEAEERQRALERQVASQTGASMARIREIEAADPEGRAFGAILAQLTADYGTYTALKTMIDSGAADASETSVQQLEERLRAAREEKRLADEEIAAVEAALADPETDPETLDELQERLSAAQARSSAAAVEISVTEELLRGYADMRERSEAEARERMEEIDAAYGGSVAAAFSEYTRLERDRVMQAALEQEVSLVRGAVSRIRSEIAGAKEKIEEGRKAYEAGQKEYRKGLIEFELETEKAQAEIRKAYQDLEELPAAQWMVLDRDSHYSSYMFSNNAGQMGAIGVALPFLFYLVAALVCMTTMTRLVDEQRGQIGILRALGFSVPKVASKYVIYAVAAALAGCLFGIPVGMAIFPTVIYNTWRLLYDLPPIRMVLPPVYLALCIAAFAVLMAVVTRIVVGRSLREVPSQLMRPKAPRNAKRIFLERFTALWNRMSFTSKVTARNLVRYKGRFIMTVIGVAGCTALLVVGWGIKDSIADIVRIQYGELFHYDYSVNLEPDADLEAFEETLKADMENEYVVPLHSYSAKVFLADDDPVITAVVAEGRGANDIYRLRAQDHRTEIRLKNSGVIVSEKFAKNHGIKKGDRIVIESENGLKAEVKVDEVCEMYFQHYLFISEELYTSVFGEKPLYHTLAVKNEGGEEFADPVRNMEGFISVVDFSALIEQFNNMIRALDIIILVIILTAGALSFVVLINLTQVNISERVREIATLKVLGFRLTEVDSYIYKEIVILSMIGGLCGLPLGVVEHHFIMNVLNMEMIMFGMNIRPRSFALAFGVTMVFTVIVLFLMRRPLRKVEMIESLKSVE